MTKAIKTATEVDVPVGVPALSISEADNTAYWKRESALEKAIQFHKTNGGMMHPMQLVDQATIFLAFLNGEIK